MAKETEGAARRFQGLEAWGTGELLETWGRAMDATIARRSQRAVLGLKGLSTAPAEAARAQSRGNLRTALSALSSQDKGGPCPR
ncbi:hypothetical protein [Stigmatella erecta]|uniref:N-acetylmuramic acid 6-phosphate etherase n=1 Tax=Stigmatella erecta TaxID=83460 RepID=A0A1I0CJU4_9BACT|nr:hypothetical protein [Stigmatella erecta]SET19922.1 N-acetylmuramic acid 6-phosphate etherase [Stigmatella erecta]